MFKKPMKVEATAIVAFGSAHELEVSFVQTFAQGTYKDRGRKTLVLVRSATGLLIAHEELRDSSLEKPDPVPPAKDLVGFLDGDGVVLTTELGTGWASGAADLSEHAGRYSTLQKVALGKIPKRFLDQRSGQVEVINSDGTICNATIGELRIASSLTPHFGTVEEWKQKKTPRAEIARELLEQSGPDGDRLVGTLAPVCKDGLVARRAGGTASIARAQALTSGVEYDAALKALRSNAAYAALTKSMKNDEPETLTENHGR